MSSKRGQDPYPRINWWTGPNPPHRCHSALAVLLWPDWLSGPRGSLQFDNLDLQRFAVQFHSACGVSNFNICFLAFGYLQLDIQKGTFNHLLGRLRYVVAGDSGDGDS